MARTQAPVRETEPGESARIVAIDMLRGFAILWVVLYHLWTDLRYPNVYPAQSDAFRAVPERLAEGSLLRAVTAASDAFLRVGYLGVPLFMLLSGLSLTLVALRRESAPERSSRTLVRRLRRVLVPYWSGMGLTLAFAAALAFVQWQRHGGAGYAEYVRNGDISVDGGQLLAGALLVPRMLRDEWQFAPEGSLWFVLVVVQYYLLFPLLLVALRRFGPGIVLMATLAITVASLEAMAATAGGIPAHRSWVEMGAPFRVFEFGAGMALGYALVRRREALSAIARPRPAAAMFAAGVVIFVAACMIEPGSQVFAPVQSEAIVLAFLLMCMPILGRRTGAIEASTGVRVLARVGVVSYALLIVSEPLRSVTHTLSAERVADGWITLWAIAGFLPLSLVLAPPLAAVLGLTPTKSPALTVGDLIGATDGDLVTAERTHAG